MEKRVLVVEPSADLRELICQILNAQHFLAVGIADASAIRDQEAYAVVIADVPFGELAAHYAAELRSLMPSMRRHLVLMSACPEDFEEAADFASLVKPFDRRTLVDAVALASG